MTVKEIAQAAGVSEATVYKRAKQLGRMPTVEEVKERKNGRPCKYEFPVIQGVIAIAEMRKGIILNIMSTFPYSCIGSDDSYEVAMNDAGEYIEELYERMHYDPDPIDPRLFTDSEIQVINLRYKG